MSAPNEWLELVKDCKYLPENQLKQLCDLVCEILLEEPTMLQIATPVTVCGDIHGQFYDLEQLFRTGGLAPATKYIFLGDYVDRGYYGLETFTLLMVLKVLYPHSITLLRGNHESRQITKVYGFYDECMSKYGNANGWKYCCSVFDLLAVAALIDGEVLCLHGGLSPEIITLDQLNVIERNCEVPFQGAFCDLLWSDPEDIDYWDTSPRGAGWLFGRKVTADFMNINKLRLICRAHQLVNEGLRYIFEGKLVTVWSAPNYCYRCGNVAAILSFNGTQYDQPEHKIFDAVPDEQRTAPQRKVTPYFL